MEKEGRKIRIGVVGTRQMGSGLVNSISQIKGMEVVALAEIDIEKAILVFESRGYTAYGSIEKAGIAKKEKLLPLGLVQGAIMKKNISQGEYITYDNVELDSSSFLLNLRKIQDEIFLKV